jgi:outer membrane PBP1 activator LpoA protein
LRLGILTAVAAALLLSACSGGDTTDVVPPLPEQTPETANALMDEAQKAAGNASARGETARPIGRSDRETVNEVTP